MAMSCRCRVVVVVVVAVTSLSSSIAHRKILRMSSVGRRRSGDARIFFWRRERYTLWRVDSMSASTGADPSPVCADASVCEFESSVVASAYNNLTQTLRIYGERGRLLTHGAFKLGPRWRCERTEFHLTEVSSSGERLRSSTGRFRHIRFRRVCAFEMWRFIESPTLYLGVDRNLCRWMRVLLPHAHASKEVGKRCGAWRG
jgi:hypothetical protein